MIENWLKFHRTLPIHELSGSLFYDGFTTIYFLNHV